MRIELSLRPLEHDVVGKHDVVEIESLGGLREVANARRLHVGQLKSEFKFHFIGKFLF